VPQSSLPKRLQGTPHFLPPGRTEASLALRRARAAMMATPPHVDEALGALREAEAKDPTYGDVQLVWAMIDTSLGKHEDALERLERAQAARSPPDATEVHRIRGLALLGLHRLAEAAQELQTVLAQEPADPSTVSTLASTLRDLGRFDELVALVQPRVDRGEALPWQATYALGGAYAQLHRVEEAALAFAASRERAKGALTGRHRTAVRLAQSLGGLERFPEAEAMFREDLAELDQAGAGFPPALLTAFRGETRAELAILIADHTTGRSAEVLDLTAEEVDPATSPGPARTRALARARALVDLGRRPEALGLLDAVEAALRTAGHPDEAKALSDQRAARGLDR
jgi:tetratricopeptide (TPR) repeat protein